MIVWTQDGLGFVCLDSGVKFYSVKNSYGITIYADDLDMGTVDTEEEATNVLNKIASNYEAYTKEIDPW